MCGLCQLAVTPKVHLKQGQDKLGHLLVIASATGNQSSAAPNHRISDGVLFVVQGGWGVSK